MSRFFRAWCALSLLWAISGGTARAHAYVVGAQPPIDGSDQQPAGKISISFDEPIAVLDADAVQVFDRYGSRVDRRDAAVDTDDATRVAVGVPRNLKPGIYTVRWRVVSADTHVVHGVYEIGVGTTVTGSAPQEPQSPFDPSAPLASLLRWLSLMGALLAAGAIFLPRCCLDRLEPNDRNGDVTARIVAISGTIALLAAAAPSLIVQAAASGGALGADVVATLTRSTWGVAFSIRIALAIVVLLAATFAWRSASRITMAAVLCLLATFSAAGHALAQSSVRDRAVAAAVDFAHLLAASGWIGGVFTLAAILLLAPGVGDGAPSPGRIRRLFAAFTPLAMTCAGIVVATGTYAALLHVNNVHDLAGSAYGRILVVKIGVVVILLWLGWRHFRAGSAATARPGIATIGYEALAGVSVVALTAVLIGQVPPDRAPALPNSLQAAIVAALCVLVIARAVLSAKPWAAGARSRRPLAVHAYLDGSIVLGLATLFVLTFVVGVCSVQTAAMFPTLILGDRVLVDKLAYRLHSPRDGDIAVFASPLEPGGEIIQRVIGIPGDAIRVRGGVVYRDGAALHEPYATLPPPYDLTIRNYGIYVDGRPLKPSLADVPPKSLWQAPDRVPTGFYFVLGDNRNYSVDSHIFGFAQAGGRFAAGPLAGTTARAALIGSVVASKAPVRQRRYR